MAHATINHVAALAGVSIKTVSRVVNNEAGVRPSTREKVEAAIHKLKYQPRLSARGLAGNRSYLVGLLYDNPSPQYVIDVQTGILATCRPNGYDLLIHPCDHRSLELPGELVALVGQSRIDGLILTPPLSDMRTVTDTLDRLNFPYARIAPIVHGENSPCVYCNDRRAAYEMAEHLIALGHRHIGFIAGHPDHGASVERRAGFEAALSDHRLRLPARLAAQGYFDFASGEMTGRRLMSQKRRPTAIFCCNDEMACGVIHVAHELGLRVPEDISITGFDDLPFARRLWPPLTTVRQPVKEMAEQASRLLLARIRGIPDNGSPAELRCQLVLRRSTAPTAL